MLKLRLLTASTLLVLLTILPFTSRAREIIAPYGASPNKQYEVVLTDGGNEESDFYDIVVRRKTPPKILLQLASSGWSDLDAGAFYGNTACCWSSDNRFLAIYNRGGRHDGETSVYS